MDIWELLSPKFYKEEPWGDPDLMDEKLLWILYCIRWDLRMPMVIHCGYEKRDSGYHPSGKAVDFHFISDAPLKDQYLALENYLMVKGWSSLLGLGVYPDWNNQGFHLDTRGHRARWGRIEGNKYVVLEEALVWTV